LKSQYVVGFYLAEGLKEGITHRVSIEMNRPGIVYSAAQLGYAQKHDFFVNPTAKKGSSPPE
jgi:hypothetical protein